MGCWFALDVFVDDVEFDDGLDLDYCYMYGVLVGGVGGWEMVLLLWLIETGVAFCLFLLLVLRCVGAVEYADVAFGVYFVGWDN